MSTSLFETIEKIRTVIGSVFLGKPEVIESALVALLSRGHLLIEDVPGVGKTLLAQALARALGGVFHRIQFTPDLLPSDIIGTGVYNMNEGEFHFKKGPLFANVVLADEINRTSPRTQSALLEAMNDGQVSVDGKTYPLEQPFLVLATQNPFEFEGTFLLPESQLDRFMICLSIGYPPREAESQLLANHWSGEQVEKLDCVIGLAELRGDVRDVDGVRARAQHGLAQSRHEQVRQHRGVERAGADHDQVRFEQRGGGLGVHLDVRRLDEHPLDRRARLRQRRFPAFGRAVRQPGTEGDVGERRRQNAAAHAEHP